MMAGKFAKTGSFFLAFEREDDLVVENDACHCFVLAIRGPEDKAVLTTPCASIEVFVPKAGHYWNGLLGMSFTPSDTEGISVLVKYGETNRSIQSRLAHQNRLDVGMDQSFVSAVEKGIKRKTDILSVLGNGVLLVDMAAQNIGSSEYVFEILASVLCSIISGSMPAEQISELLENEFFPPR